MIKNIYESYGPNKRDGNFTVDLELVKYSFYTFNPLSIICTFILPRISYHIFKTEKRYAPLIMN